MTRVVLGDEKKHHMKKMIVDLLLTFAANFALLNVSHTQICQLSDEFAGESLDPSWLHYQSQYYQSEVSDGFLTLGIDGNTCMNNCPWFHGQSAGFVYKIVYGNFEFISAVESEQASGANAGADINNDTQLGGLMARDPNDASENYVFNVVGTRFDVSSIETKSTTNNNSGTIEPFGIASTRAELRMTREGSIFRMYSRNLGASDWIHRSTFNRPDLPETLQVGLIAYAFESYPVDLAVKFDYVKYSEFSQLNSWVGGSGFWNDASMWSLAQIPNSSHHVLIDNAQAQTIQIGNGEDFSCLTMDVHGELTEFIVEGQLEIGRYNSDCGE